MSKASPRRRAQHRYLICASLIAAATMVCETTRAQEAKGQEAGLTEIIVTAQKRAEPLQKTPLAISAVSSDTIQARRISDSSDLNAIAPNIATASGPASRSNLVITIRGIGETDPILTNDSPVGVYVDGVIVGRSAAAIFELVDLERIEVLRGPQGTLYGRNTTGGAVNLITKKPSKDFGLDMTASHGNGLALSGTAHWMFDRGLIGQDDDMRIIVSRQANDPDSIRSVINASGRILMPQREADRPHPQFIRWHREHCFKH